MAKRISLLPPGRDRVFLGIVDFANESAWQSVLSRWALIFVVEARQRAKGFYAEGKRILVN
jgi:hypothetical protein